MDLEDIRELCLSLSFVTESFPFDESTLVFKVDGKMFALISLSRMPISINLKAKPEDAITQREEYIAVSPGYHMNKTHWNTINISEIRSDVLESFIKDSYDLVVAKFTKKRKRELGI
jgi:predicted DNA-binding protein (MmcQ/YjbR family)